MSDPFSPATTGPVTRRFGLLSTYPPKLCGLATFTAALERELVHAGDRVTIVAVDDGQASPTTSTSHPAMVAGDPGSIREAAAVLSDQDVAIVQHEYGIYGGPDGDEVLDLLRALTVPAVVVLHTVPLVPTPHQRSVLEQVCELAARVVVMTEAAATRLLSGYTVDASDVVVIPHGATPPGLSRRVEPSLGVGRPARLLTWGLLGPGKGIEHAIRAVSMLGDLRPQVRYTVAGATHPKVFAREGDHYRRSLIRVAHDHGAAGMVRFDDSYRDLGELMRFVAGASLVILPYDSRDQVTSGVLVDAVAAGRPVIATAFPHAVELLSGGAGMVVPHADPAALAAAIRTALCETGRLDDMAAQARALAPGLSWHSVARQYQGLCDALAPVSAARA
jgi:glycosyltransferase involved in cell wall biosynthesis